MAHFATGWIGRTLLALFLAASMVTFAHAQKPKESAAEKIAIKGYDTVAYFTKGAALKGKKEFQFAWEDRKWLFESTAHREAFAANPERYAPQYSALCAMGMAEGFVNEVDPEQWTIVDGKLYLNFNRIRRDQFRQNLNENIRKADQNWQTIKKTYQKAY